MQFPVLQQQDLVVYPSHIYQSVSTTTSPKLSILPSPIPLPLSNHQSVFYVPDQGTRSRTHTPQLSVSMSQLKILYVATNTRRSQVNKYFYLKKKKPAHFIVNTQCVLVTQSCPTLCAPIDCSCQAPLSMEFSGQNTGVGCHFLLQSIFPTQGSNQGLLHCRQSSLPPEPPGKPKYSIHNSYYH